MALKIDVLMPFGSQYGVLHHFALKIHEALTRQGAVCRLLAGEECLRVPLKNPPDYTIGFNGAIKMEDDSLFCDLIKIPHISWLVDPPFRFLEITKSPFVMIACDDAQGCDLLNKRHFKRTVFLPHAVERELNFEASNERIFDIVFLGSSIDAEANRTKWKKQFPSKVCRLMEEAARVCLEDTTTSFMTPLLEHFDPEEYREVFQEVELYVKGVDRLKLIKAFPSRIVHVFGDNVNVWKKLLKTQKNIMFHEPVPYHKSLEIMKQSKVVLNSSVKNKWGAHERIFSAAACGAVVVTNDNPFMRECFNAGMEMLLYSPNNIEGLDKQIDMLLKNEGMRREMAMAGRLKVMQGHTWDHRVEHLLKLLL